MRQYTIYFTLEPKFYFQMTCPYTVITATLYNVFPNNIKVIHVIILSIYHRTFFYYN